MADPVVETGVNPVPPPTLIEPQKKIGNNQFSKEARAKRAIENDASLKKLMDPVWRLCNLYQVRTKVQGYEGQTVRFYPNTVQKRIYNAMAKYNRVIILKPRKLGVTTALCVYLLDKAMYSKNQSCRTIAHRKQTVAELFNDIVRYAFDRVSPVIRPEIRYSTRAELDFGRIGSKYSIDVEARGMTPTLLHLSETAYIDDEAKLQDTLESLPLTARGVCESTANGKGNWFERTFTTNWKLLQQGRNPEWYPMFFAWFDDPTNYLLYRPGDEFYFKSEVDQLRATYKNMDGTPLSDRQLLWWDRKRLELGHRMPELYPSNPDEAFIFSTGRVYDEFNRVMHVVQPVSYTDYDIAMDFGLQNPMVFLCIHQDGDGNFTVFKEFYRRGCSVQEAAAWLHAHCPEKKDSSGYIHVRFPDPSVHNKNQSQPVLHEGQQQDHRASIADEFNRYKVILYQGVDNDVITGITRVKEYLRHDPGHPNPYKRGVKGAPRLYIGENCSNTLLEFDNYRWPDRKEGSLDKTEYERPIKENDHAMDAMRYCILNSAKPLSEILAESVERGTVSYLIQSHRQMLEARDQPQVSDY